MVNRAAEKYPPNRSNPKLCLAGFVHWYAARGLLLARTEVADPGSIGWQRLMTHYKEQILACDFFTVETIRLKTLYVFFFIELATHRIHLAGITANPDGFWVAQQARQLIWRLDEKETPTRFLIRDNDRKYTQAFDTLFRSEGIHIISIPFRAPNANSYAERWVRTVREECLDHLLILNEAHHGGIYQLLQSGPSSPRDWTTNADPISEIEGCRHNTKSKGVGWDPE